MRDARGPVQGLAADQAALVTLSAAIAGGDPASVAQQTERALETGASPNAVYEIILQSYLFVGFPRAIEALFASRPALERAGAAKSGRARGGAAGPAAIEPAAWTRAGESLCRKVYGRNYDKLMETMRRLSPDLAAWMLWEGYGKTLSRPGLDPVEREYAVVAALTVTRMWRQLRSHAIGSVNVGGTRAGVRDAITRSAPWAGSDRVAEALRVTGLDAGDD